LELTDLKALNLAKNKLELVSSKLFNDDCKREDTQMMTEETLKTEDLQEEDLSMKSLMATCRTMSPS
jgi:hypothetical protein